MAQFQDIWNKFNPRERLSAIGAGLIILAWLIGILASRGLGTGSLSLLGAIAVLAILYIKYAPNMNVTWPAPVSLLVLVVSAVVALAALLTLLDYLGVLSFLGASAIVSLLLYVAGAAVMLWGAWQEYQVVKPAMPNFGAATTPPPAAPTAPAAPAVDNTDEAPPV